MKKTFMDYAMQALVVVAIVLAIAAALLTMIHPYFSKAHATEVCQFVNGVRYCNEYGGGSHTNQFDRDFSGYGRGSHDTWRDRTGGYDQDDDE